MFLEAVQWGAWSILILWVAGASTAPELSRPCPQQCECHQGTKEVNCSRRQLTSVPESVSSDSRRLDLAHNHLKTLSRRQFSGLAQLQELDLSNNIISMIEVEAFQGLQSLQILRIKSNRLKIIPVGVFSGLSSLRTLDISKNEILVFLDYTFRELISLQQLEAGENDLVFISQRAFMGLQNLQELNLDSCNLTSIPIEALSQLQNLTRMHLRRLSISILPSASFHRLSHLRDLRISQWASLDTLTSKSLTGLNLTSLSINKCNLSTVPYASIQHLVFLRYLDLSYNPITVVRGNLLADLIHLQEFHLAGGRLVRIEPEAFKGLAYLRLLNVSSNQLPTLEEGALHSVGNLETLRLDNNPLSCDCRLLWVVQRRLQLDFDGYQPYCSAPAVVRGRAFWDFTEVELPDLFTCRQAQILDHKPQDVRVEEGSRALFHCMANGDPPPSITWMTSQHVVLLNTGRIRVSTNGTLEIRYAQVQDSGSYLCTASNIAGNDSFSVSLQVSAVPNSRNRTAPYFSEVVWTVPSTPTATNSSAPAPDPFPFDAKTLIIAMTMGFLSFLSSVIICFVFMFVWSQSQGQIKHTATINFVPRASKSGGGGDGNDSGRFTMKLI
ncbi:leucine-rich repeat and immunoglobulin-like domain-containing nogo receptor-interacting protein 4b [Anguilla anguilla]|uniref:leucine-rich repeat and immunoglobulin-like domain-containing nogo receptor-interacting protein 4b n=1 Tax=Anguilla anguilla TaxID=7936 RepID=UPI0015A7CA46|nr:leucine-rich repeat and immunoglobulin-like domain-containing nogo receptor-interacting protein 4b [Anguilla anguilla]XP_035263134.1 leucine-rich repeat and immunoglobulin-like domain-containing nogo receptor-interacting protein 4b [Anguilla anguilla]XP_035263142.1 leucine-rich repeat and immunoglobulin-like domain-containing nogo receptor-interacting protein 4b [Anguilla anguilla]